jgi:hypothetical protein
MKAFMHDIINAEGQQDGSPSLYVDQSHSLFIISASLHYLGWRNDINTFTSNAPDHLFAK